jgi:RNA chaperone Hfq
MRKYEVPVTVDLASGVRRQGYVTGFDGYSILLVRDWQSPVVYKYAASAIMPGEPVRFEPSNKRPLRLEVAIYNSGRLSRKTASLSQE